MTLLPRMQLFEFMDLAWFPGWLRRCETDFVLLGWRFFAPRKEIAGQLSSLVAQSSSETIVDLCSGSGGLVTAILEDVRQQSGRDLSLVLTDAFPNPEARLADGISYWPEPVDARAVDPRLSGVRTMFASLHHFPPGQAREILLNAKRGRHPIAVYEMTPRSIRTLVLMTLNVTFGTLLLTPFLRPFSWQRLLFTYALPLVPLTLLFDGIVSVFRTYTKDEMLEMAEAGTDPSYEWHSGVYGSVPGVVYLHGSPKPPGEAP
jgi:hypothetical protein